MFRFVLVAPVSSILAQLLELCVMIPNSRIFIQSVVGLCNYIYKSALYPSPQLRSILILLFHIYVGHAQDNMIDVSFYLGTQLRILGMEAGPRRNRCGTRMYKSLCVEANTVRA